MKFMILVFDSTLIKYTILCLLLDLNLKLFDILLKKNTHLFDLVNEFVYCTSYFNL